MSREVHPVNILTTIQGRGNKHISFISAYIAVSKGSVIGTESLYAQQVTIHEKVSIKSGSLPSKKIVHGEMPFNN
jgi:hypothetical protein